MKTKNNDWVIAARARHHEAIKAMMPSGSTMSGIQVWRKLRVLECRAGRLAIRMCNSPECTQDEIDRENAAITAGVEKIFGRPVPGFFINHDPRGWALKLEPGSVPYRLHEDWGRYQILAPLIDAD